MKNSYGKLIKDALTGKPISKELTLEIYNNFLKNLSIDDKELNKSISDKISVKLEKFSDKVSNTINKELKDTKSKNLKLEKILNKESILFESELSSIFNHSIHSMDSNNIKKVTSNYTFKDFLKSTFELSESRQDKFKVTGVKVNSFYYNSLVNEFGFNISVKSFTNSNYYNVNLYFNKVIQDKQGFKYDNLNLSKINLNKNLLQVSCDCSDYVYTFSYVNQHKKCHLGSINTNQPPDKRNSKMKIGICKHIITSVYYLKMSGYIQ